MPAGSGRKQALEWEEVDILENDTQKAACKYCNQSYISVKTNYYQLEHKQLRPGTYSAGDYKATCV